MPIYVREGGTSWRTMGKAYNNPEAKRLCIMQSFFLRQQYLDCSFWRGSRR